MRRFNRVHAVCRYLRMDKDKPCLGCPAWHTDDEMPGRWTRACYRLAVEAINIAKYGHPFGKKATAKQVREWRAREAKRTRPRPNLRIVKPSTGSSDA